MTDSTAQAQMEGPTGAASAWINAILRRGSLAVAWPLTDPENREVLVTAWLLQNSDHPAVAGEDLDTLADDLASLTPDRLELWHYFDVAMVQHFRWVLANVDLDVWGWASDPRPMAVDLEGVLLVDAGPLDEHNRPLTPGPHPAIAFVMRYVDGAWLVNAVAAPDKLPGLSGSS